MVEMRAGLVGWKTHYLRPIIPYYQTLGVALVITPRQISRPPDAFIKRLLRPQPSHNNMRHQILSTQHAAQAPTCRWGY